MNLVINEIKGGKIAELFEQQYRCLKVCTGVWLIPVWHKVLLNGYGTVESWPQDK